MHRFLMRRWKPHHMVSIVGGSLFSQKKMWPSVSASIAGGAQVVSIVDDSDDQSSHHTSDTESVDQNPRISRRRLRLMWDPDLDARRQAWHPEARAVECLFRELASRTGAVPHGAPIPRPLRQQRWSLVNVPLMWGAASSGPAQAAFDHGFQNP